MHPPEYFLETDQSTLLAFIRKTEFATLAIENKGEITISHLPLLLEEKEGESYLHGHLAKNNKQCKLLDSASSALVLFQGPHAYVSSSWYKDVKTVPTWNYIAVHVSGKPIKQSAKELQTSLEKIVEKHEFSNSDPSERIDEKTKKHLMQAIVGFRIKIESITGHYKLSQNRSIADQKRILRELSKTDDFAANALAVEMEQRLNNTKLAK